MEELFSIKNIDDEIKADARKKAQRILKQADSVVEGIQQELEQRIARAEQEQQRVYTQRIERHRADCKAFIPLEKERKSISFVDTALRDQIREYFQSIGVKKLNIVKKLLQRYCHILENAQLDVLYAGISEDEAKTLLHTLFAQAKIKTLVAADLRQMHRFQLQYGFRIETDSDCICRASIDQAVELLLAERREQLFKTLFPQIDHTVVRV